MGQNGAKTGETGQKMGKNGQKMGQQNQTLVKQGETESFVEFWFGIATPWSETLLGRG